MRNFVLGLVALVLLPVVVTLLVALSTGVLTGGITDATGLDVVNGFSLADLRSLAADDLVHPEGRTVARLTRSGSNLAIGPDVPPLAGRRVIIDAGYGDVVDFYDAWLTGEGWEAIDPPDDLRPRNSSESSVRVWRTGNLYYRLVRLEDPAALVEAQRAAQEAAQRAAQAAGAASGAPAGALLYETTITPIGRPD